MECLCIYMSMHASYMGKRWQSVDQLPLSRANDNARWRKRRKRKFTDFYNKPHSKELPSILKTFQVCHA